MHAAPDKVYPVSHKVHAVGDVHVKQLAPQALHLEDEI